MKNVKILLSGLELKTIKLIANGKSITEIAKELSLSELIIKTCRSTILEKMKLTNNAELTQYVMNNPMLMMITPPEPEI